MTPIRSVSTPHALVPTLPGERPPGTWRYSSRIALALSGGGARAAYQVGVLQGLAERLPGLEFPILTGVSAGAINTAFLAAHLGDFSTAVEQLRQRWTTLTAERIYDVHTGTLIRAVLSNITRGVVGRRSRKTLHGLVDTAPLREFLRETIRIEGIDSNIATGRLRAAALSATSYTTGRSVTFVHAPAGTPMWERAQRVSVAVSLTIDHIMASAALPIVFPAICVDGEFYGDGSISHLAPLAPALHLGARAIVAIGPPVAHPTQPAVARYPSAAQVLGLVFRAIFLDALEADAERLERVNRTLAGIPPGAPQPGGLHPVELLMIRPSRELDSLAVGQTRLLPTPIRWVVRALGGQRKEAAEFLGHLLFHPTHTGPLMELGYRDVSAQWPAMERFFEKLTRAE